MNEVTMEISFPLDADGFIRRECPLCNREFKLLLNKDEMYNLVNTGISSFMINNTEESGNDIKEEFLICPYCGQESSKNTWWTQEQVAYINKYIKNIFAKLVNENLIKPLEQSSRSNKFVKFEGKEIQQEDPWISPEINDMRIFNLPCCNRKIKIEEDWTENIYCYFCGFPYSNNLK